MRLLKYTLMAMAALFLSSCTKGVEHTGDTSGNLYGNWVLDTKTITQENSNDETVTDFSNDHFYLGFMEPKVAFGKEGSIFTFDIDDVDAVTFAYNKDKKQITFEKAIVLSKGFPPRVMELFGTYDVLELTSQKLVLSQPTGRKTTVYSYHKLVEHNTDK